MAKIHFLFLPRLCFSSCLCHQAAFFQIGAALPVAFRPVAVLAARRNSLRQPSVGQAFAGAVNPAETEGFLHHFKVRQTRTIQRFFATVGGYPTAALTGRMLFQPLAQLLAIAVFKKVDDFHNSGAKIFRKNTNNRVYTLMELLYIASLQGMIPCDYYLVIPLPNNHQSHQPNREENI